MSEDLQAAVETEKAELLEERAKYVADQHRTAEAIEQVDRELKAIEVYEQARTGKPASNGHAPGAAGGPRSRRTGIRADVLDAIARVSTETGIGLTRGEILLVLGMHGDKSSEMSVSNALTALMKRKRIVREGGRYVPA